MSISRSHPRTLFRHRLPGGAVLLAMGLAGLYACEPQVPQRTFDTPEEAAEALIASAEVFDVQAMTEIFGPAGLSLVVTEDTVLDRIQAERFAEDARQQLLVIPDPTDPGVAHLAVGPGEWPVPIPLVLDEGQWRFDSEEGGEEILLRRIGQNELDAIEVCLGYVEAQYEYASERRGGFTINQYARRVISTPGEQDGLAWQTPDGTWEGPVGEGIARVISDGYTDRYEPFYGYYFKILEGQGPNAPMGEMDFLVKDIMIGGFALVAAPADYEVTGIKTFIVSHDGIVYEQDLGSATLDLFQEMDRYDPGPGWTPVQGEG